MHELTPDGRTPQQQIAECYEQLREIEARQREVLELVAELKSRAASSSIRYTRAVSRKQQKELRDHYIKNVFPLVTPQALDPAHPFPFVSNLSLNLLVTVRNPVDNEDVDGARQSARRDMAFRVSCGSAPRIGSCRSKT